LATDIANLLLTCRDHGTIIDDKTLETEYPEPLLLEFKRAHERRIHLLTECTEDVQTDILLLQVPIDGRVVTISPAAAARAVRPQYPADEQPMVIDLNGLALRADSPEFFAFAATSITQQTGRLLARRIGSPPFRCLSVFALAPIPLLVHFGHQLGDVEHVDLYQRHRDQQDWTWKEDEALDTFYDVRRPEGVMADDRPIALVLSVSEVITLARMRAALGQEPWLYEIRACDPSRDFLRSRKRLEMFGYEVRKLLYELRTAHVHERVVHLFAAVPAPLAIEFGRSLNDYDPPFLVYEYHKAQRALVPMLTVNGDRRRPDG
jgi:hypothetical protein